MGEEKNQEYARKCPELDQLWKQYHDPFLKRALELKESEQGMQEELDQEFQNRRQKTHAIAVQQERCKNAASLCERLLAQLNEFMIVMKETEQHHLSKVLPILQENELLKQKIERLS